MPTRRKKQQPQPNTERRPIRRRKKQATATAEAVAVPRSSEPVAPAEHDHGLSLRQILSDPWLRFTHLYYTKDKHGYRVPFVPWPEQEEIYRTMHYLNLVLKARQRGVTTAIQLFMLDRCLFNDNINAGVIAHNREDAEKFFDDKIKFAYDNLPEQLRRAIPARSDNKNELTFSNGSSIRVGTSMRSGTLQYLHISEYGKICAKFPDKAQEIKTGSLNTVAPGNFVFIESTAEGAHGHFYELCQKFEQHALAGKPLGTLDYKFFFFPWYRAPEYTLQDTRVEIDRETREYFEELAVENDIHLTPQQKAWYVKKREEQGDVAMTQEYPATPEEAFRGIVEGAVYGKQLRAVRKERRITRVPWLPHLPVNTFWDIGRDMTSIWFHQRVGAMNHFIDFYQEPNRELAHFAWLLLQDQSNRYHEFTYGVHYFPHDMGEIDYSVSESKTRKHVAEGMGLKPARIVDRILVIDEGIEMTRQAFSSCMFDAEHCDDGIKGLENYRYERDEKNEVWRPKPLHNWASHPADAFRQFAQGYKVGRYSQRPPEDDNPLSRASRRKARNNDVDWRT